MARVSIVVPTYNRLALLNQAIASVIAQSWPDWELVVVDDGSDDGTPEYVRSLADRRITCVQRAHTGNPAQVRNAGAQAASGAWLAFLDSDDLWTAGKLGAQLPGMQRTWAAWSYTAYDHVDAGGNAVPARAGLFRVESGDIVRAVLRNEVAVAISSLCVSRLLFERVGGFDEDPRLCFREDYDLVLRLAEAAPALGIPEVLVHVREHAGRATHEVADPFERMAAVYARFARSARDPALRALAGERCGWHLAEAARIRLAAGGLASGLGQLSEAIRMDVSPAVWLSALGRGLAGLAGLTGRSPDAAGGPSQGT